MPEWFVVPVGGGGTIAAIWRAFGELRSMGLIDRLPRMAGVQPRHYNTLEMALQRGLATEDELASLPFDNMPPTIPVKLQHTILPDGAEALASIRDSGGALVTGSDMALRPPHPITITPEDGLHTLATFALGKEVDPTRL